VSALGFAAGVAARVARLVRARSRIAPSPLRRLVLVRPLRPRAWLRERTRLEHRTVVRSERFTERTMWRTGARTPVSAAARRPPIAVARQRREEASHHSARTPHAGRAARRGAGPVPRAGSRGASEASDAPPVRRVPRVLSPRHAPDRRAPRPDPHGPTPGEQAFGRGAAASPVEADPVREERTPGPTVRGDRPADAELDVDRIATQVLHRLERMALSRRERMGAR
jgi:hypothetical protein